MIFPDQDSTNFPIGVKNNLTNIISQEYTKKEFLRYHQYVIYQYMIKNQKIRGLLLFHEMGMGKSISAVALAEYYRKHDPNRKIVILLSKSLQENFRKNINAYIKERLKEEIKAEAKSDELKTNLTDNEIETLIDDKYKFVSLNASNMFTQITRVDKTDDELLLEKQLQEFTDIVEKKDFLENTLLIVDEFHNLANSITNGSLNAIKLYDTIMKTKDIKLLFLTGTPIVNNPFELVPTFNMLRGLIKIDSKTNTTLFPELKKDFDMYFVDHGKNKIKNIDRFQNRIFGMVSYYGSLYFGKTDKQDFPKEYPIKVVKVHMSADQFSRYNAARDLEREEAAVKGRPVRSERFSAKGSVSSSYRVKSRQISNYLIPEYALGPVRGNKAREKFIDKISDSDILNTKIFSPKFAHIIANIKIHANQLGLFYSEFVSGEGIAIFSKLLDLNGYRSWNSNLKLKDDMDSFGLDIIGGISKPKSPRENKKSEDTKKLIETKTPNDTKKPSKKMYAIISGDVSIEERNSIIKTYNSIENISGKNISLLIISKTGAEGLDLKNVRHIHICEPYWNIARIDQIIARGVRYKSHIELPKSEQNVQPYIYLSDYPIDYNFKKKKEETTDIELYQNSRQNKFLIDQFLVNLAEASVDCSIHESEFSPFVKKQIKCKMCSPNNKLLYHPILSKDLLLPNPCQELKSEEIKVKEILVNGNKYYYSYTNDTYHIFKFDTEIQGYTQLQEHDPVYADIIRILLKLT
jgi:hypothetical protein